MCNFEQIQIMTLEELEDFLDQVYLTGLNNGMYAQRTDDDEILEDNPFGISWLNEEVEDALRPEAEDEILTVYAQAVLRNAGIPFPQ